MYNIKVNKSKTPAKLQGDFHTYNNARAALRTFFREHLPLSSGHVAISDIKDVGFNIVKK